MMKRFGQVIPQLYVLQRSRASDLFIANPQNDFVNQEFYLQVSFAEFVQATAPLPALFGDFPGDS